MFLKDLQPWGEGGPLAASPPPRGALDLADSSYWWSVRWVSPWACLYPEMPALVRGREDGTRVPWHLAAFTRERLAAATGEDEGAEMKGPLHCLRDDTA